MAAHVKLTFWNAISKCIFDRKRCNFKWNFIKICYICFINNKSALAWVMLWCLLRAIIWAGHFGRNRWCHMGLVGHKKLNYLVQAVSHWFGVIIHRQLLEWYNGDTVHSMMRNFTLCNVSWCRKDISTAPVNQSNASSVYEIMGFLKAKHNTNFGKNRKSQIAIQRIYVQIISSTLYSVYRISALFCVATHMRTVCFEV